MVRSVRVGPRRGTVEASSTVADLAKEAATLLDLPVAQTKITCGGEATRSEERTTDDDW